MVVRWILVQLSGPFLGTLPGWITALSSMGLLSFVGVIGSIWLRSRRLGIDERKDRREGYGNLLDRLEADAVKIKTVNVKLYDRVRRCESRDAAMKLRVGELNFVVRAMTSELKRLAPNSEALAHALELMAVVYPPEDDEPDDGLEQLIGEIR